MFAAPPLQPAHNNNDGHHNDDPAMNMERSPIVPAGHDNSDGHHDDDVPSDHSNSDGHHSVSSQDFKERAQSGNYTVIDVRTPEEISEGKITSNALEINFYDNDFEQQIRDLNRDEKYLLYCRSGSRSGKTLQLMEGLGFNNVLHLDGGKNAWDISGLSTSN
jgi:rhodanese-related sulfurtransferase